MIFTANLVWLKGQRHTHLGITVVARVGSGHTEDGIQFAAHAELSADDGGIAAEPFTPEFVVEDDYVIVAGLRVFRNEMPAEKHSRAVEEVEEAGGYAARLDLFGPIGGGDGEAIAGPAVDGVAEGSLLLPVDEVTGGSAVAVAAFVVGPEHDDAVAIDVGEGREEDGVEEAEDGGGGADAQGQGEQGHRGESQALPE